MDLVAKGDDFEKKAEKKLNGWGIFGSKYEDAADLFDKAAKSSLNMKMPPISSNKLLNPDLSQTVKKMGIDIASQLLLFWSSPLNFWAIQFMHWLSGQCDMAVKAVKEDGSAVTIAVL